MDYYISTTLNESFESARSKVEAALKDEGFGVISEVNMQEKLKDKLNVDFRKYTILGACNPPMAYESLQVENKVGLLLPCNVILQEIEPNKIEVASIDPFVSMQIVDNDELSRIAKEVKERLESFIKNLK
ncbi:MAG: hypothetical protein C0599_13785 [Salinivirgaceae bacterium]|nr:MAG: hypothetical protein C0599_13785 [Salinivirgaceae bacterium]